MCPKLTAMHSRCLQTTSTGHFFGPHCPSKPFGISMPGARPKIPKSNDSRQNRILITSVVTTHRHAFEMSSNDINWSFYLDRTVHQTICNRMPGVGPKIPKSNDSRQNPDINHVRGHVRACLIRVT
ncbi:hypothetical protein CEXT_487711 [Caerostris extrusa]|uniref:Uncharacterized protein n=1 Tax=Caerostris extrusa TaxID=172846 RepID=A0AAV4QBR8_CAEEX|nr:hypothetical protein CEXT_487711 [Caerostris extrusa]